MLHQGIAGPIQSGSSPLLLILCCRHSRPVDSLSLSPPPPSVSQSSTERLPPSPASRSVTQQPRPASLHHPPLYISSSIAKAAAVVVVYATAKGGGRHECLCASACCHLPFTATLHPSSPSPSLCHHVIPSQDLIESGCQRMKTLMM